MSNYFDINEENTYRHEKMNTGLWQSYVTRKMYICHKNDVLLELFLKLLKKYCLRQGYVKLNKKSYFILLEEGKFVMY